MLPRLCGWAAALVVALALGDSVSAQEVTRVDPVIEIQQKVPEAFDPDEPVRIEVRVRNTGRVAVESLTLTDVLQAGVEMMDAEPRPDKTGRTISWALGQLAPGEERLLRFFLKQPGGITNPRLVHTIDVSYQARGRNVAEARVRGPKIELKIAADEAATVGTPMVIRITVSNQGSGAAREVVLLSDLPEGLSHPNGNSLEKDLGTLEAGRSRTIALTVTPTRSGELLTKLRVNAKGIEAVEEESRLAVKAQPLKLTLPAIGAVPIDQSTLFEMVVENDSTQIHKNVEVRVALPKDIEFVRATDRGNFDTTSRSIVWDLGTLEPGERRALVWNGIPKSRGLLECKCSLMAEGKKQAEAKCPVRVLPPPRDRQGD